MEENYQMFGQRYEILSMPLKAVFTDWIWKESLFLKI